VHEAILGTRTPQDVNVVIQPGNEAELDEMWSVVGDKGPQRWWWHAIDPHRGPILADVLGTPTETVVVKLTQLLAPCGMTHFDTADWGTYQRNLHPQQQTLGQEKTQKIDRKHLTLRTRIKRLTRKTICFSKSMQMHDIVLGLFVNRDEFGLQI
jgi:insertion element IS1 protein InsB